MMPDSTQDIIARLLSGKGGEFWTVKAAADRLAELDAELATVTKLYDELLASRERFVGAGGRPPCPTCGGKQSVNERPENIYGDACPDCVDGRMPFERMAKIVAAVFDDESIEDSGAWYDESARYRDYLRAIR